MLKCKSMPFALPFAAYCCTKAGLLHCKRASFVKPEQLTHNTCLKTILPEYAKL